MRIALSHPTYWPEVRRGSERVVHDLAAGLAARGHQVTILTSHRARAKASIEDGVEVIRAWRPPGAPPLRHYEDFVHNAPNVFARLARPGRFDVVQAFSPSDAWAAGKARGRGGPALIYTHHGTPTREYLVARRYRLEMIRTALAAASEATVLSEHVAVLFRRYLQVDPVVLPAGVDLERFSVTASERRDDPPSLLCAADLRDPRKRGSLLLEAFGLLRRERPEARLRIALGGRGAEPPPAAPGVDSLLCDDTAALARAYGRASATVLPSIGEALGLVTLESMAAGTPVVAADSGASSALVSEGETGALFVPDDPAALCAALVRGLELAADPATPGRCRAQAAEYDWEALIPRYESIYERALNGSAPRLLR